MMRRRRSIHAARYAGCGRRLVQTLVFLCVLSGSVVQIQAQEPMFRDITDEVGLGFEVVGSPIARCLFVDLNGDRRPDVVVQSPLAPGPMAGGQYPAGTRFPRVFLHTSDEESPLGFRYREAIQTALPALYAGDGLVFADLDNDGQRDAIITRNIDANNPNWTDHGQRTAWYPGRGDGTFGEPHIIDAATPATTAAIAVGDVDRDGSLDLAFGHWYTQYGATLEGYPNELITRDGPRDFVRTQLPHALPDEFDSTTDLGGRPTYGMMIAKLLPGDHAQIIELNYGRRWNRLWMWNPPRQSSPHDVWSDIAPRIGFDGDEVRHGKYPEWLKERAKTDPRFDRPDEMPFRANGNTFDVAVGDIDNNGDFDLFISEIAHGWAGASSDRSRFLVQGEDGTFSSPEALSVDRIPDEVNNWNQGDLFCELADFNNDGLLDLLLSSGDYPDDERLRLFLQQADGTFRDVTADIGLDHDGSQMISLGDVNGDGALDILVGQTFNRFTAEQREGRTPQLRLFVNQRFPLPPEENPKVRDRGHSLVLYLEGDPALGINRDALGAIVMVRTGERTQMRQLIGIGGHAGKQQDFMIHFGLGEFETIDEVRIIWPNAQASEEIFENVRAGRYTLRPNGGLIPLD